MHAYRSHNCAELSESDVGQRVRLSGWVNRKRDHGQLVFVDLRDHYGITQCVIENKNKYFPLLEKLKPESVLKVSGKVVKRSAETANHELKTGKIEISHLSKELIIYDIPGTIRQSAVFPHPSWSLGKNRAPPCCVLYLRKFQARHRVAWAIVSNWLFWNMPSL